MKTIIVVKAMLDSEAGVWFVESSDLAGLNVEAGSFDDLLAKLPAAIEDLLQTRAGGPMQALDVPVELIAHASTRVRVAAAA